MNTDLNKWSSNKKDHNLFFDRQSFGIDHVLRACSVLEHHAEGSIFEFGFELFHSLHTFHEQIVQEGLVLLPSRITEAVGVLNKI